MACCSLGSECPAVHPTVAAAAAGVADPLNVLCHHFFIASARACCASAPGVRCWLVEGRLEDTRAQRSGRDSAALRRLGRSAIVLPPLPLCSTPRHVDPQHCIHHRRGCGSLVRGEGSATRHEQTDSDRGTARRDSNRLGHHALTSRALCCCCHVSFVLPAAGKLSAAAADPILMSGVSEQQGRSRAGQSRPRAALVEAEQRPPCSASLLVLSVADSTCR